MKYFLIFLGILAFVGLTIFSTLTGTYNRLVSMREETRTEQSQVEAELQRRFDLVPQIVGAVRGAIKHEEKVFGDIAEARTHYANPKASPEQKANALNQYEGALARLMVVMENYPQLAAIQNVKDLQVQLEGTENRISVARMRYNETAKEYNKTLQSFPTNIIGGMFGFTQMQLFQSAEGADKAPVVNLE